MRVLLVNENFPPADLGGTETSVLHTAIGLAEEGHEVHVLARYPGHREAPPDERFTFHGIPLASPAGPVEVVTQEYVIDPRRLRLEAERLAREVGPFDVVHANNGISAMAVADMHPGAAVRALTVRSYIYACPLGHGFCLDASGSVRCGSAYECARHRHDGNGIERAKALGAAILYGAGFARVSRAAPRFDVVLADSAFVRRSVEEGTDVRVRDVVYEAVDADARRVAREPAEEPLALFAGRISAEKGIFVLLEAFARARRLVPQARLHIAGSGPRLVDAKEAARRLGVGRAVEFLGRVPNERLPALYARAWCVAVPSTWPEPFGIVAAEAALCGAPVLASRIGGLPEALAVEDAADPAPHALVPPGDVAAWADALVAALQQPGSVPAAAREAVAARVGRREVARRLVRAYGARTVANA